MRRRIVASVAKARERVTVPLDASCLKRIDDLVATGAFPDRSSATVCLINKGLRAIRDGLDAIHKEEEQLRTLMQGEAAPPQVFERKGAIAALKKAVDRHRAIWLRVSSASERLHQQRTRAALVVERAEDYRNRLSHSPTEFDKVVADSRVEAGCFENDVNRLRQEYEHATRVGNATSAAGALAGLGVFSLGPTAAMAVATTFGTASTGTAISALSGAAAANAALAWLGGGALAAGGGGLAAGNALLALAGPAGWTLAGAAIVGAAVYRHIRNKKCVEEANILRCEVEAKIRSLTVDEREIESLDQLIKDLADGCSRGLDWLAEHAPCDYRGFDAQQKERLAELINIIRTLGVLFRRRLGGDDPCSHQPLPRTPASPLHPGDRQEAALEKAAVSRRGPHVAAQTAAAWTAEDEAARRGALDATLTRQDQALEDALREMQAVEDFVGRPEHILGSASTKHGEIAEQFHVAVRRAFDLLHQRTPSATFEGVGRLAPEDYVDGGDIQSKYYKSLPESVDAIASHAERYGDFVSRGGCYHIPRDQFASLAQLGRTGTIGGLPERRVAGIRRQIELLEKETGRSWDQLIAPGEAMYDEVQAQQIAATIEHRRDALEDRDEELQAAARVAHGPSLDGAVVGAGGGAAAGASARFAQAVWEKMRAGRNPFRGDFSVEDWNKVGMDTSRGAAVGGVAGGALYLLTNATSLAAPFAGSLVSCVMGVGTLLGHYQTKKIDATQFVDLSLTAASDAAIVGLSAVAGQTFIPLPMLGAFVGSVAGKVVAAALRGGFTEEVPELAECIDTYCTETTAKFDTPRRAAMAPIDSMARLAFDESVNSQLRLATSVRMAQAFGVTDDQILRSSSELDTDIRSKDPVSERASPSPSPPPTAAWPPPP